MRSVSWKFLFRTVEDSFQLQQPVTGRFILLLYKTKVFSYRLYRRLRICVSFSPLSVYKISRMQQTASVRIDLKEYRCKKVNFVSIELINENFMEKSCLNHTFCTKNTKLILLRLRRRVRIIRQKVNDNTALLVNNSIERDLLFCLLTSIIFI